MKTIFVTIALFSITIAGKAQQLPSFKKDFGKPKIYTYVDSATLNKIFLKNKFAQMFAADTLHVYNKDNTGNMPILLQKQQLAFVEHNNKGFDIYQSTPDNMYTLKPDSTFHSATPIHLQSNNDGKR